MVNPKNNILVDHNYFAEKSVIPKKKTQEYLDFNNPFLIRTVLIKSYEYGNDFLLYR